MGCLYQAVNIITGKRYIGVTVASLEKRKSQHLRTSRRGSTYYFHTALRKYGEDSFKWEEIVQADCKDFLYSLEKDYLASLLLSGESLYNTAPGGRGGSQKGRSHKKEAKTRLRSDKHHLWGTRQSKETRLKRSGENHGRAKLTSEQVLQIRLAFLDGSSLTQLSNDFDVGITTVGHITSGNTWSHVGWPIAYG